MTTQLELLTHDCDLFHAETRARFATLQRQLEATDESDQNLALTLADQFYRTLDLADGVAASLARRLRAATNAVARSLLETVASTAHVCASQSPRRAAEILRAYSLLRWVQDFPEDHAGVAEWTSILERIPADAVEEARRHVKSKRGWTGMSVKNLLASLGFTDYRLYAVMASEGHGGIVGRHATLVRLTDTDGQLHLSDPLTVREVEIVANFARRALHRCFTLFWDGIQGDPFPMQTPNPSEWRPDSPE